MRIIPTPSLARLTTLRIGGNALAELHLSDAADCDSLPAVLERLGGKAMVLGGGSNVLAAEGELPIVLIRALSGPFAKAVESGEAKPVLMGFTQMPHPKTSDTITAEAKQEAAINAPLCQTALVRVGAGQRMPALLAWCAAHGFSGLEGLVGVPGHLGGAVAMNAGAYGCSTASVLRRITVFTPEGGVEELGPEGWQASYRHFKLTRQNTGQNTCFVVLDAELALPVTRPEDVKNAMLKNMTAKKSAQPLTEHTAGCVFKNPPGLSAGKLLDEAGFRGKREGHVFFTEKHANFLAHDRHSAMMAMANSTSGGCHRAPAKQRPGHFDAAISLLTQAREAVARTHNINLELEVKIWPSPLF